MATTIVNVLMDNGTGTNVKLYYIASQTGSFTAEPKRFDLTASLITAFGLSPDDYEPGDGYTLGRLEFIFSGEDKDASYIKIKDKVKAIAPDAKFSDNGKTWTELQSAEPPPPPPVAQTEQSVPDATPVASSSPEPENINNVAETKPIEEKRAEAQKDIKPQAKIGIDGYASSPVVYDITHFNNPDGTYKSMVSKGYDVVLTDRIFAEIQNKNNIAKTESKAGWTVTPDEITVPIVDENVEAAYSEMKSKMLDMWPLKFTKDTYLGEVVSDVPESKSAPRETNNNTSDTDATINKNKLIDSAAIGEEGKKNILEVAKKEKKLVEKAKPSKETLVIEPIQDTETGDNTGKSDKPVIGPASEEELQYQYSDEEVTQDYYNTADNVNNPSSSGDTSAANAGDGIYYEDMVIEDDNYGAYQPVSEPGTYSPTSSSDGSGSLLSNPDAKSVNISSDGKSSLGGVILNASTMKATLQKLNYKWYDKGINMIGIRAKSIVPDAFNDLMVMVWYENGQEKFKSYIMTTYPGKAPLLKPKISGGVAIMKPGQYINAYYIGYHLKGVFGLSHPCLQQNINIPFYRDNTKTGIPHTNETTVVNNAGSIGMNIHRSNIPSSNVVSTWSEGCQVFKIKAQHDEFLIICEKFREQTGNKFTYTLIRQEDIVVPQVQASTGNSSSGLWG